MEKTSQEIAELVYYAVKIAEAFEQGEADFVKESAAAYRVIDRTAIRRASLGMGVDSQHMAKRVLERKVPIEGVLNTVRALARKFKALRAKGKHIPNNQYWFRKFKHKDGSGYVAGHGPMMRTVYESARGQPRGIAI